MCDVGSDTSAAEAAGVPGIERERESQTRERKRLFSCPGIRWLHHPVASHFQMLVHVNWISNEAAQRQLQGHVLPLTLMLRVMLLEPRNAICFICRLIYSPIYANTVHSPWSWSSSLLSLLPGKSSMTNWDTEGQSLSITVTWWSTVAAYSVMMTSLHPERVHVWGGRAVEMMSRISDSARFLFLNYLLLCLTRPFSICLTLICHISRGTRGRISHRRNNEQADWSGLIWGQWLVKIRTNAAISASHARK